MSKARLIITAVVVEGRSQAAVAREYGVSKGWVSRLIARYRTDGDTALEPRSRRPRTRPDATPPATVELILQLRRRLTTQGLDAGADTIAWHLQHHHQLTITLTINPNQRYHGTGQPPGAPKQPRKTKQPEP